MGDQGRCWWSLSRAVVAVAVIFGVTVAAPEGATTIELPHVDLSASSPAAIHHPDGSWTIPIRTSPAQGGPGFCRGTFINPEIVARGRGTAVHFAAKFFCTRPVTYSVTTGVVNYYEVSRNGPVTGRPGGQASTGGVSQNPYVEGFSPPCRTNENSGWEPWHQSSVNGGPWRRDRGTRITVGCRL